MDNILFSDCKGVSLSSTFEVYPDAKQEEPLELIVIDRDDFYAVISLQGAQLLEYQPKGDDPWLWVSPYAEFYKGKSIRGGIPICLPWFGVNQQRPELQKHGFVRNDLWDLHTIKESNDSVDIVFCYEYKGHYPDLYSSKFKVWVSISLSDEIEVNLRIENDSKEKAKFSWALHTYFYTDVLKNCTVAGLSHRTYLDNTDNLKAKSQIEDIFFDTEIDRVYEGVGGEQVIKGQQNLQVTGSNCPTCIVWNPSENLASTISDIRESYKSFVCVERGMAFSDHIYLDPGKELDSQMIIRKEKY